MVQVVRIASEVPALYAEAVDRYLASAGVAESSRRVYRISLTTWAWLLTGEQPPARRRGARPPDIALAALDDPRLLPRLAASFAARAASADADTVNRELSVLRAAVGWWQAQGWVAGDPSRGLSRLPASPDRTRALSRDEVAAVFRLDVALRDKYFELEGRFPCHAGEVPRQAIAYVGEQLRLDPDVFGAYTWSGRTIEYHRAQIRAALDFRECTVEDEERQREALQARCRAERIEPPGLPQVETVTRRGLLWAANAGRV